MPAPGSFTLFAIVPHTRNEQVVEDEEVGALFPLFTFPTGLRRVSWTFSASNKIPLRKRQHRRAMPAKSESHVLPSLYSLQRSHANSCSLGMK